VIEIVGRQRLGESRAKLVALYRRCFAQPPWNETSFDDLPGLFDQRLAVPGMWGILATQGDSLLGVVYGWPSPEVLPDKPFYRAVIAGTPDRGRLVSPAVQVVELMVDPDHQGRGIGRALLDGFVAGQRAAWLCTHPEAPARRLYESAGWVAAGAFTFEDDPRVVYTWEASDSSTGRTGSTARTAVPESSLR
jgi:GNAT superfamily N-acetyltransferase